MEETKDSAAALSKESKDHVALELMKFIATTTGYGKGSTQSVGFGGKGSRTPEEYVDSLLQLFERCRKTLND